jgi:CubicO group peptidase (beta-lactamase class C family)
MKKTFSPVAALTLTLVAVAVAACPSRAQTPASAPPQSIAASLRPFVDNHTLAGAVALVASRDKLLCLDAVGYADVEAKTPMRTDNMFWIASMTKSITATALMMLVDEGKLSVDDPAAKYLPELDGLRLVDPQDKEHPRRPRHPLTVKELFSHTHGMADARCRFVSLQDDVVAMAAVPMEREPGTKYRYSNMGINAGGRIVEKLGGMPFGDFLQRRLFAPLGMRDTTFWPDDRQAQRLARTFKRNAAKTGIENLTYDVSRLQHPGVPTALLLHYNLDNLPIYKNHYAMPCGGLYCTAADLGRFCRMLLGGGVYEGRRYLSAAAIRQMTSIQTGDLPVNPWEGYGLGWSVEKKAADGHPSVGSYGHRGARKTMMWIDPATQRVMILLLQSFDLPGKDQEKIYGTFIKAAEALSPVM